MIWVASTLDYVQEITCKNRMRGETCVIRSYRHNMVCFNYKCVNWWNPGSSVAISMANVHTSCNHPIFSLSVGMMLQGCKCMTPTIPLRAAYTISNTKMEIEDSVALAQTWQQNSIILSDPTLFKVWREEPSTSWSFTTGPDHFSTIFSDESYIFAPVKVQSELESQY